jgi:polar amino acid transport system substrate-binding protein
MKLTRLFILLFTLTALLQAPIYAQLTDSLAVMPDTTAIRVGISGSSPFVLQKDGHLEGISYEVWEAVAAQSNWKFTSQQYESVSDGLSSLQKGDIDVLIGPISITSARSKSVRFTQPYFQSSLSILSNSEGHGWWDRIAPFFSKSLLYAVFIFLFILSIVGTLVWLTERNASPEQFPKDPAHGIANGMWLAIVTMTTTGYGDKAPITFWGRIITGIWMIISIIFSASLIAGIASTLTLTGIQGNALNNVEQLSDIKVAVIKNSPALDFINEYRAIPVEVSNLDEAYQKLKNKEVAAVVYDRPQMMYFLKKNGEEKMHISKAEYYKQGYGFATNINSPLSRKINIRLLELSEQNRINRIVQAWLGDENK